MRKASQDTGDTTSITSGLDGESKKPGLGLMKTKRNSLKKKVRSFSHDSDDAVIEPLLQRDKEKTDVANQSAKFLLAKTKTDSISEKGNDKDKLLADNVIEKPSITCVPGIVDNPSLSNGINENIIVKSYVSTVNPIHNHMNTNMFGSHDGMKGIIVPKTQILVEIDGNKQSRYNPPIFTTAKIHTDEKVKQMQPVQILSTIEGKAIKTGSIFEDDKNFSGSSKNENITNIGFTKPVLIEMKTIRKDEVAHDCPTISRKDTATTISASQTTVLNVINEATTCHTSVSHSSQPLDTITERKTSVTASCGNHTKMIVTSPILNTNESIRLKDEPATKTTLSDYKCITVSESAKTSMSDRDTESALVYSGKTPIINATKVDDTFTKQNKTTPQTNITENGKISTGVSQENKMDVNKNFESVCIPSQKPGTSNDVKSPVNTKAVSYNSDAVSRTPNNKFQRQKISVIEDIDPASKAKSILDQLGTDNPHNATNKSNGQTEVVKEKSYDKPVHVEVVKKGTDAIKIPSANNVIVTTIASLNTVQNDTNKSSVITSKPAISSLPNLTFSSIPIKSSIPIVTSAVNKSQSATVSTFKSPVIVTATTSHSKPARTGKSVATDTTTKVTNTAKSQIKLDAKPVQNLPSTTTAKTTTVSNIKPKAISITSQSGISVKSTLVSTVKSSPTPPSNISLGKITTSSPMPIQSTSKGPTKAATTKVMNTQVSATKSISSIKAVPPPVVPPTTTAKVSVKNKQVDSKSSEHSKDLKSFK